MRPSRSCITTESDRSCFTIWGYNSTFLMNLRHADLYAGEFELSIRFRLCINCPSSNSLMLFSLCYIFIKSAAIHALLSCGPPWKC
jgi:hypothetical protein